MVERFMERRIVKEFLGTSELDDGNIKKLLRDYFLRLQTLTKEEDLTQIRYHQGYIAALGEAIRLMRFDQKTQALREDEE